ncbi:hypothetical protein N7468_001582 [Penicillium chermesinum]|uniref:Peptidase S26 domain-containing protein n=1 Tax=Penicillium chermesinum TaxID=63820 RepID=A0A9W9PH28_9EURO|nr:uncharacterized protein N7468_001582 [Penicillium chermesinum]KAJ5246599.1 hypothetical protein N7468_001582 [Penicillium chermesinum]
MERILRSLLRIKPQIKPRTAIKYVWFASGIGSSYLYFRYKFAIIELSDGPSMYPTLNQRGDWLLVSRHYRHGKDVQVGDIVRFRHPTFLEMQAAKRVVGMPGDFVCSDPPLSEDAGISTSMIQVPTGHAYVCGDNLPGRGIPECMGQYP